MYFYPNDLNKHLKYNRKYNYENNEIITNRNNDNKFINNITYSKNK